MATAQMRPSVALARLKIELATAAASPNAPPPAARPTPTALPEQKAIRDTFAMWRAREQLTDAAPNSSSSSARRRSDTTGSKVTVGRESLFATVRRGSAASQRPRPTLNVTTFAAAVVTPPRAPPLLSPHVVGSYQTQSQTPQQKPQPPPSPQNQQQQQQQQQQQPQTQMDPVGSGEVNSAATATVTVGEQKKVVVVASVDATTAVAAATAASDALKAPQPLTAKKRSVSAQQFPPVLQRHRTQYALTVQPVPTQSPTQPISITQSPPIPVLSPPQQQQQQCLAQSPTRESAFRAHKQLPSRVPRSPHKSGTPGSPTHSPSPSSSSEDSQSPSRRNHSPTHGHRKLHRNRSVSEATPVGDRLEDIVHLSSNLFDKARSEVLYLMTTDSHPKWIAAHGAKYGNPSLKEVLKIPDLLADFSAFLASGFSSENLQFYKETTSFRERTFPTRAEMRAEAVRVFVTYLAEDAESQVNISGDTRLAIRDALFEGKPPPQMSSVASDDYSSPMSPRSNTSGTPSLSSLDHVAATQASPQQQALSQPKDDRRDMEKKGQFRSAFSRAVNDVISLVRKREKTDHSSPEKGEHSRSPPATPPMKDESPEASEECPRCPRNAPVATGTAGSGGMKMPKAFTGTQGKHSPRTSHSDHTNPNPVTVGRPRAQSESEDAQQADSPVLVKRVLSPEEVSITPQPQSQATGERSAEHRSGRPRSRQVRHRTADMPKPATPPLQPQAQLPELPKTPTSPTGNGNGSDGVKQQILQQQQQQQTAKEIGKVALDEAVGSSSAEPYATKSDVASGSMSRMEIHEPEASAQSSSSCRPLAADSASSV